MPVQDTSEIGIRLGDGHQVLTRGKCDLSVDLGPITAAVSAYVFNVGSLDLILGMSWLETLGTVQTNWKQRIMTYNSGKNQLPYRELNRLLSEFLSAKME